MKTMNNKREIQYFRTTNYLIVLENDCIYYAHDFKDFPLEVVESSEMFLNSTDALNDFKELHKEYKGNKIIKSTFENEMLKELQTTCKELYIYEYENDYNETEKEIYLVLGNQEITVNKKTLTTNNKYYPTIESILHELLNR